MVEINPLDNYGFTIDFFKNFWTILGKEVCEAIKHFQVRPYIPRGINSAFIVFIPKKTNPIDVQDFRPISLVGTTQKIISKLLANRLKQILHFLISPEQSAFVRDRQILDGPLIINEVLEWAKNKKEKIMIFKTDIAKAYDSVDWAYLDEILIEMGFGTKWRLWINTILHSGFSSILINGSPTDEF